MFGWFSNKKIKIKPEEIPIIAEDMQEIFRNLAETCVIGMVLSTKTHSPEIKNNPSWKIETIHDVPELRYAFYGYQVCSMLFFLARHLDATNTELIVHIKAINKCLLETVRGVHVLEDEVSEDDKMVMKKINQYFIKYSKAKSIIERRDALAEDVKTQMQFPKILQQQRLDNSVKFTVNSMHAQVFMELASYFGEKKLADKYMVKAGKGILVE
jgi:hypothetical protein|tara:strand:- start:134 stop:772 length:639 start_codon:yes stop_codon:yes gene_type:complete